MPAKVKSRSQDRDYEDLVRLYLEDVGRHNLLTKDDEIRLAQAIEQGIEARTKLETTKKLTPTQRRQLRRTIRQGEEAHRQFVNSNLRLVVSIAKKYQSSGLPLLDIVQEGNLGLIHAVDKFDWRKGFKFSTYATWWIRQAIQRGIANSARVIRLPVHAGDMLTALLKLRAQLEGTLGRTPTLAELANEAELPLEKVVEVLRYAVDTVSLDEPVRDDGDAELGDFVEDRNAVAPFDHAATSLLPGEIAKVLAVLDDRETHDPHVALRPRRWRRAHARGSGRALRSHPRADPPDRGPGDVEAAAPVGRRRRPRAARSRLTSQIAALPDRPPSGAAVPRPDQTDASALEDLEQLRERGVGTGLRERDAAVGDDRLAGDVAGASAREEEDHLGDLLRLAHPAGGHRRWRSPRTRPGTGRTSR